MLYNKEIIKTRWGVYCDTDKLVDDMMALLTEYNHRNSEHGVCKILNSYFEAKKPLIDLISTSENYAGDMRIILKVPFVRECVADDVHQFIFSFKNNQEVRDCILSYKDSDGKTLFDYITTGSTSMNLKRMKKAKNILNEGKASQFHAQTGATKESRKKASEFDSWMVHFHSHVTSKVDEDRNFGGVSIKKGMKTSRAFNRVCTSYGVDKWQSYNREFAKYADMVSSNERVLNFFISVNPLDYLTMSFGKSWASCHTIDKDNIRGMPDAYSGMYCNGTMSYMLDGSSLITFAFEKTDDQEVHKIGKVYRNMFHLNIETCKFIQGRLYPQGNDGSTDLYAKFRGIMQDEFAKLFNLSHNVWKFRKVEGDDDTITRGRHYADYYYYDDCKTFYPTEKGSYGRVDIGANAYCCYCGESIEIRDRLSHSNCIIIAED